MKIVIKAASAKMGGAATYITTLLRSLPPPESGYEFDVFLPPETADKLEGLSANVRLIVTSVGHAAVWKRFWWEQVTLRLWLKKRKADVLFATGNFGMFHCPVRQLLLVTNTLYFSKIYRDKFMARHSWRFRVPFELRRWLICESVRQADWVMTPTHTMLDELRNFVDVPQHQALVNHYGVDAPEPQSRNPPLRVEKGRRNAGTSYNLLYISLYGEHKNLGTLLKAIPLLNQEGGRNFLLQTTVDPTCEGSTGTVTYREDRALAQEPSVSARVRFVGALPREQTERLYLNSDIFVFPSLTESFGFPMAEAMSHGLPIVASDTPVNREMCGEAAVYFSPLNPEDLARQVHRVAADQALYQRLRTEGRRRAATMCRWEEHVGRVLEVTQTKH
jgi:glycosyltransferase involved in cell wall biosynthesis